MRQMVRASGAAVGGQKMLILENDVHHEFISGPYDELVPGKELSYIHVLALVRMKHQRLRYG